MTRKIRFLFAAISALFLAAAAIPASAAPLVNVNWLRQNLHDKNLVVIEVYDTNNQQAVYKSGHIPGAVFTAFLQDGWRTTVNGIPYVLPPIKDIEKVIGSYGVDNNSEVVLVPGGRERADFPAAMRVYWTFKVLGHNNVSILNGGDKAWFANTSDPVASGVTTAKPKTFVAHFQRDLLATREDVEKAVKDHSAALVDARIPAQYEGLKKSPVVLKAGTLPGAVNVPTKQLISADGTRLADAKTIDEVLAKAGVKATGQQISFCNTGHLASGPWFVLHEVKGNKDVSLYDGSMADWTRDPKLPVVKGTS
jgi:thiosulfate/3-mercaptopyruvate sulfurtransferase